MSALIREYRPEDEQAVVELSLGAWAPVFASIERALGRGIFDRLYGDWRRRQEQSVRGSVTSDSMRVWVAEGERGVIGFVAAKPDCKRRIGEVMVKTGKLPLSPA